MSLKISFQLVQVFADDHGVAQAGVIAPVETRHQRIEELLGKPGTRAARVFRR